MRNIVIRVMKNEDPNAFVLMVDVDYIIPQWFLSVLEQVDIPKFIHGDEVELAKRSAMMEDLANNGQFLQINAIFGSFEFDRNRLVPRTN